MASLAQRLKRTAAAALSAAAGAVALVGVAVPAGAHDVDPTVVTVLDEVVPTVDGLVVEVAVSVTTQLLVENRTDEVLEVLDEEGRPFLRIGPGGVEADVATPAWVESNSPFAGAALPPSGAPPQWRRVATEPAWGWFDHRLHPQVVGPLGEDDEVRWVVPMRLGDAAVEARGHLARRRVLGGFTSRLVSASPFADVVVQLLDGRLPGFFVRNDGPEVLTVFGAEGEPFARIGPSGSEVNRRSPTWLATAQARGEDVEGLSADPGAEPDWFVVGPDPSLAWLDERGRFAEDEPPAAVLEAGVGAVVLEWSVPVERGGTTATIDAVTAWVPAEQGVGARIEHDGDGVPLWAIAVPAAVAVVGAGLLARRRRTT